MRVTGCWLGLVALGAVLSCSGDNPTDPGAVCNVANPVAQVSLSPVVDTVRMRIPARPTDAVQLTAVATGRAGNARSDVPISFSSSDTAVAIVSGTGLVQLRAPGRVVIRATACDQSASATVVAVANVTTIVVTPAPDTLVAGDSLSLTAAALDDSGAILADAVFTWSSSAPAIAPVTGSSGATAMLQSLGAGSAMITASAEGSSGSAGVVVLPREFLAGAAVAAPTLDAGLDYTCALITQGRGYCWGADDAGQLGASADSTCFGDAGGSKPCTLAPQRFGADLAFSTMSAGDGAACGITTDGRAYCWGANTSGQLGNGLLGAGAPPKLVTSALTFTSISAGGAHACAIASDKTAWCWGSDEFGQLGDKRLVNSTTPIPVVTDPSNGVPEHFAVLSAGFTHSCGITVGGVTWCWGADGVGQLGTVAPERCQGTTPCSSAPIRVTMPADATFAFISAGADHTCALDTGGRAWCWGANDVGQLGTGSTGAPSITPVLVSGGHPPFTRISAGTRFTCAIDDGGKAWCWGFNRDLQLGIGPYSGGDDSTSTPQPVFPARNARGEEVPNVRFASISAGQRHACGVSTVGKAYCWGSDVFGALGNTLQAAYRGIPQEVAGAR